MTTDMTTDMTTGVTTDMTTHAVEPVSAAERLAAATTLVELREIARVVVAGSFDDDDRRRVASAGSALEKLTTAVDEMSQVLNPAADTLTELSDAQLDELVRGLVDSVGRLEAHSAVVGHRWSRAGSWARDGSRHASGRLARDTHRCARDARRLLHRGRALAEMPATSEAFVVGRIGVASADLLIRTRDRAVRRSCGMESFGRDEAMLVGFCATMRHEDASRAIDYWLAHLDPDADEADHQRRRDQRRFGTVATLDQMTHVEGMLDPLTAAMFNGELDRLSMKMLKTDRASGSDRTAVQRRADALAMMALRSRQLNGGKRPAPLLSIVIGRESFARMCELANGTRLAPGLLVPLLSEAQIETFIFGGRKRLVGASRKRFFTGALRRAIEIRDRRCTHPSGCDIHAEWSDVDHIIAHSRLGPTAFENGRVRCATHNRQHAPDP